MDITSFLTANNCNMQLVSFRSRYDDDLYIVILPNSYVEVVTSKIQHGTELETRALEDALMLNPNYPGSVTWRLIEGIEEVERKLEKTTVERMKRYLKKNIDDIIGM